MIRSIVGIKLPILIQDIQVVIEANISQWKVERYDIELTCPFATRAPRNATAIAKLY